MLKIDNLAVSKDLDRAEMSAIAGGSVFQNNGINSNYNGGFSALSSQTNIAPVTQVDASQHTDVDVKNISKDLTAVGSELFHVKV